MAPLPHRVLWLSLGWVAYGGLHSLLAAPVVKRAVTARWPGLGPAYRLLYNLVATVALLPLVGCIWADPGPWVWRWMGGPAWVANGLAALAGGLLLLGSGTYDLREFSGLRAWEEQRTDPGDQEPFRLSALHRHVRHPWYSLSLVILWTRDMSSSLLVSALWITGYVLVGSRLEEARLVTRFGARYRDYQARVPALLPRPWRRLSAAEAQRLEEA